MAPGVVGGRNAKDNKVRCEEKCRRDKQRILPELQGLVSIKRRPQKP
jgi:hypothetical protein